MFLNLFSCASMLQKSLNFYQCRRSESVLANTQTNGFPREGMGGRVRQVLAAFEVYGCGDDEAKPLLH